MRSFQYLFLVPCILICLSAGHNAVMTSKWKYEVPITISASLVDGSTDFTNMPYYINLSALPAHFWNNVKADGEDIRLWTAPYPGGTELPLHIISFIDSGASGTGTLFTKRTIEDASTTLIYLRYGNPNAVAPADGDANGKYAVYSALRQGWAMNEASGAFISLMNGVDMNRGANATSGTSGKLEKNAAQWTSGGASLSTAMTFPSSGTFLVWMKFPDYSATAGYRVLSTSSVVTTPYWGFVMQSTSSNVPRTLTHNGTSLNHATASAAMITSSDNNTWVYTAWSHNSGAAAIYRNGSALSMSDAAHHSTVTSTQNHGFMTFGTDERNVDMPMWFSSVLIPDHIMALYRNQNTPNNYHTVGTPRSLWKPQIVN